MTSHIRLLRCFRSGILGALAFLVLGAGGQVQAATSITSCGMTLSSAGIYVVTQNLTASGQDCITVATDNVAIDLKKHSLNGDGTHSGITDGGNSVAEIIVANGTITNFHTGISLFTKTAQTADLILNMNVSGNTGDGIDIQQRDNLVNIVASSNGGNGIKVGRCCDSLFNIATNGNGSSGIVGGDEDFLLNVTTNENTGEGFSEASDSFFVNSKANNNGSNGVDFTNCDDFVVSSQTNGNTGDGVLMQSCDDMAVDSKAGKNHGDGFDFQGNAGLLTNVSANGNTGDGVFLTCQGNAVQVAAKGNATNLHEDSSGGTCTNVRNKAL